MNDNRLFPLHVTPFEHYMLADDHTDFPMTLSARVGYSGTIDRERFVRAVEVSLRYHPLLRAVVSGDVLGPTRHLRWMPYDGPPAVHWTEGDDIVSAHAYCRLDPRIEAGLRVDVDEQLDRPSFVIRWHHACADGLGMLSFLESLLLAYRDGDLIEEPYRRGFERDPEWWNGRARHNGHWARRLMEMPRYLTRVARFFARKTAPLTMGRDVGRPEADDRMDDPLLTTTLGVEETAGLARSAKTRHVSVNDLLLRDYFLALHEWNDRFGAGACRDRYRVAIPINLRMAGEGNGPAINNVSMVFIDRAPARIRRGDHTAFLNDLAGEMRHVKRWNTGWALIHVLALAGSMRTGMARVVGASGPSITSVLSNLGHVLTGSNLVNDAGQLDAGSFVVQSLESSPPLRPGVRATVLALTYANRLVITTRYDPTLWSRSAANEFHETYARRLRTTSGANDPPAEAQSN